MVVALSNERPKSRSGNVFELTFLIGMILNCFPSMELAEIENSIFVSIETIFHINGNKNVKLVLNRIEEV